MDMVVFQRQQQQHYVGLNLVSISIRHELNLRYKSRK